jgi:hypothetical protein
MDIDPQSGCSTSAVAVAQALGCRGSTQQVQCTAPRSQLGCLQGISSGQVTPGRGGQHITHTHIKHASPFEGVQVYTPLLRNQVLDDDGTPSSTGEYQQLSPTHCLACAARFLDMLTSPLNTLCCSTPPLPGPRAHETQPDTVVLPCNKFMFVSACDMSSRESKTAGHTVHLLLCIVCCCAVLDPG